MNSFLKGFLVSNKDFPQPTSRLMFRPSLVALKNMNQRGLRASKQAGETFIFTVFSPLAFEKTTTSPPGN